MPEFLEKRVVNLIILVLVFGILVWFIHEKSSGELLKKEALTREISLAISSAEKGTEIKIQTDYNIEIDSGKVLVYSDDKEKASSHDYFTSYEIILEKEGEEIKVIIK